MEVYVDDMLVKTKEETDLLTDLSQVFNTVRLHGMRLNPTKCTFAVEAGKFLGFMLTQRGIKVNPDKCKAILEMKSSTCLREVQQLNGRLAALSRFLAGSALRSLLPFSLLRKGCHFEWTPECEEAFQEFKRFLSQPPILTRPIVGEELVVYLSVADRAVASALIQEDEVGQHPVYFTSKVLQGPELNLTPITAVFSSAHDKSPNEPAHEADPPEEGHCEQNGPMGNRALRIRPEIRSSDGNKSSMPHRLPSKIRWRSREKIHYMGVIFRWVLQQGWKRCKHNTGQEGGTQIEVSLKFEFPASNNQVEYEALIAGLKLAEEVGATKVMIFSDSQVVTSQINREYQAKDPNIKRYLDKILEHLRPFEETEVKHITRDLNSRVDAFSKLASTKRGGNNRSLIQETLPEPSVVKTEVVQDVFEVAGLDLGWMKPLVEYLKFDILPKEEKEAKRIRREAQNYTLVKNILYKRGISTPLLKCIPTLKTTEVLEEVHNGICGNHLGARSLARKGLDLLGPFPQASGQVKYLIVGVDYFTKWIEVEPLATITTQRSRKFFYKNIITRYGVPNSITTDNGTQFTDSTFKNLVASMKIKHQFTSVEHPQANGQAEAANKVILAGLKKRLQDAKGA
ncbi:uncharacterized protein LOC110273035 [Arachis duranensis]|uniref:Uncharacterized protein LOC110273035 n=1 Tax=Arachis duranensis TaxID=130453 RepID=A0A6P5M8D4_ARADU|nr:uncharacterized protein LOC110273035 [Arachis duranensis]